MFVINIIQYYILCFTKKKNYERKVVIYSRKVRPKLHLFV